MGQNRIIEGRGAPLYIKVGSDDARLIEGVLVTNVPGPTSQRFPIRDVLDTTARFGSDIPDPGVASFSLNFNPVIPTHADMRGYQKNDTTLSFEWGVKGEKVNGVNTQNGITIGTVNVTTVSDTGVLVYGTYTGDIPRVGDILEHSGQEDLKVVSADYTNPSGVRLNVVRKDNDMAPTAVAAESDPYTIKEPAQLWKFGGKISGLPTSGGQIVTAAVTINIEGEVIYDIGDPDV